MEKVVASVGSVYFTCSVMVNSDSDIPYTDFDESGYLKLTADEYPSWKANYKTVNRYLTDKLNTEYDDKIIEMYQGSGYYTYMNGATDKTIYENQLGTENYGEGYEEMFMAINHACGTELSRYQNSDSMVLYSGAGSDIVQRITGNGITLAELKNSVGRQFDVPMYTSTTLDPYVSNNFYQKGDGVTLVIYVDKETLATYSAGYIAAYHPEFEYELLLAPGQRFEVIDAGIRYLTVLAIRWLHPHAPQGIGIIHSPGASPLQTYSCRGFNHDDLIRKVQQLLAPGQQGCLHHQQRMVG